MFERLTAVPEIEEWGFRFRNTSVTWDNVMQLRRSRDIHIAVCRGAAGPGMQRIRFGALSAEQSTLLKQRWFASLVDRARSEGHVVGTACPRSTRHERNLLLGLVVIAGFIVVGLIWKVLHGAIRLSEAQNSTQHDERFLLMIFGAMMVTGLGLLLVALAWAAYAAHREVITARRWQDWRITREGIHLSAKVGDGRVQEVTTRNHRLWVEDEPVPLDLLSGGRLTRLLFFALARKSSTEPPIRIDDQRTGVRLLVIWPLVSLLLVAMAVQAFSLPLRAFWFGAAMAGVIMLLGGVLRYTAAQESARIRSEWAESAGLFEELGW